MSIFDALAAPFPADAVSWRVGSTNINKQTNEPPQGQEARGMALAYLDARDVMDRLDQVCGPDFWQCRYSHVGATTVCEIGIHCADWIWKSDGAGATDVEAEKGMLSDAFKRAAVRWGIGRYLYGLDSPWVKLVKKGRTWLIDPSEMGKLRALLVREGAQGSQDGVRAQFAAAAAVETEKARRASKDNPWEDRSLPEDQEFPGVPLGTRGKTAHFARQDGDDEVFKTVTAEINDLESNAARAALIAGRAPAVAKMPARWRAHLAQLLADKTDELKAIEQGEAEFDEAFRGTVGSPRNGALSGRSTGQPVNA